MNRIIDGRPQSSVLTTGVAIGALSLAGTLGAAGISLGFGKDRSESLSSLTDTARQPRTLSIRNSPEVLSEQWLKKLGGALSPLPAPGLVSPQQPECTLAMLTEAEAAAVGIITGASTQADLKLSVQQIDRLISDLLKREPESAEQAKAIAQGITQLSQRFALTERTREKAFILVTSSQGSSQSDNYLVEMLGKTNGWKELFLVANYSSSSSTADAATQAIACDRPQLREWLIQERAQFLAAGEDSQGRDFNSRFLVLALQESAELNSLLSKELERFEQLLTKADEQQKQLAEAAKAREATIAALQSQQAELSKEIEAVRASAASLEKHAKESYQRQLKEWEANHITVAGNTHRIVRVAASNATVGRQEDFVLDVKRGETILFQLNGYGSGDTPGYSYRLKQNRRKNSDPTHNGNMVHGHTWVAQSSYADWNKRAYVHRNSDSFPITTANFIVVAPPLSKPTYDFNLPEGLATQIGTLSTTLQNCNARLGELTSMREE
jgi:hypothetical protein